MTTAGVPESELEGIAILAVTFAEMTNDERIWRATMVRELVRLGRLDAGTVRAAAERIALLPTPPDDDADYLERSEPIYEWLGLPTPSIQLADTLRARDWMSRLATDLTEFPPPSQ